MIWRLPNATPDKPRVIGDTIGTIDISELATKADLAEVKADLRWIKLIGGTVLAVLILPWFTQLGASIIQ